MPEFVLSRETTEATIPSWVVDLDSFIRWADSSDFPTEGRYSFIRGRIRADLSMEQLFSHNRLNVRITTALDTLVVALALGYVFGDKARLRNSVADLSVEPDMMFVSLEAVEMGRVVLTEGAADGYVLVDGTPEVAIEVVSDSSVTKDTVELRSAYFDAGIREYWLIDGRGDTVAFDILRRGPKKFVETKPQAGGWLKSVVFGHSFRITQAVDRLGNPQYTLEHRA